MKLIRCAIRQTQTSYKVRINFSSYKLTIFMFKITAEPNLSALPSFRFTRKLNRKKEKKLFNLKCQQCCLCSEGRRR